jgi:hypothetical protein
MTETYTGRADTQSDIAETIYFLASLGARDITGQSIRQPSCSDPLLTTPGSAPTRCGFQLLGLYLVFATAVFYTNL